MTLLESFYYVPMIVIGLCWLTSVLAQLWAGDEGPSWKDLAYTMLVAAVPLLNIYIAVVIVYCTVEEIESMDLPLFRGRLRRD